MAGHLNINRGRNQAEPVSERRRFIGIIWLVFGIIALAELAWVFVSFLRRKKEPANDGEFGSMIKAGPVDGFVKNSVTAFPRGHFYLVRLEDGSFLAIHRRCTHLGCTVPWNAEQRAFICPCHLSAFSIRGDVIRSPAPRALDRFPITIENNTVWVDTHRKIGSGESRTDQIKFR